MPTALDAVLVAHIVANKALVKCLHSGVSEKRKGVVMLQQPVVLIPRKVNVMRLLQIAVVKHWLAIAAKASEPFHHLGVLVVDKFKIPCMRWKGNVST